MKNNCCLQTANQCIEVKCAGDHSSTDICAAAQNNSLICGKNPITVIYLKPQNVEVKNFKVSYQEGKFHEQGPIQICDSAFLYLMPLEKPDIEPHGTQFTITKPWKKLHYRCCRTTFDFCN